MSERKPSLPYIFLLAALAILTGADRAAALEWDVEDAPEIDANAVLRGYAGEHENPVFRLELPAAGVATVDLATAADRAAAKLAQWPAPGAVILEQSATHLAFAVREPGTVFLRVSAEDPREPLGRYKLTTSFVAARVLEESSFLPSGDRVTRTSFRAAGPAAKGDPEDVDPDPNSATLASRGRRLASFMTLRPALAEKGDPEDVDPDPNSATFGVPDRAVVEQVLSYAAACRRADASEIDDHGDTMACATPLALGSSAAGEIGNAHGDDADVFVLTLTELATIELATIGEADTFGVLSDRNGQRLAVDDDGGGERNFRILATLAPGRYFLRVEGAGAEGAYELRAR